MIDVAKSSARAQQVKRWELRERRGWGERCQERSRAIDEKIREGQSQRPAMHMRSDTGIQHASAIGIEIGAHLCVVIRGWRHLQHRYHRRQAAPLGKRET